MATKKRKEVEIEYGDKRKFKKAGDFVSLYVNNTTFGYTRFDFQILFGRVEVSRDTEYDYTQETATITMTPEYAKAFLVDFARVLKEYEAKHGEIGERPEVND